MFCEQSYDQRWVPVDSTVAKLPGTQPAEKPSATHRCDKAIIAPANDSAGISHSCYRKTCRRMAVLGVLWLNGNSNGHTSFLLFPQVLNWTLFFFLAAVLTYNLLHHL